MTQSQTYILKTQSQTYTPETQSQTYIPETKSQTHIPETQSQTHIPETQSLMGPQPTPPPSKPLIPLRTSCKMLILILHGFHHRLQFIYRNPSFRCGRPAKCSCEVYMDPIIDCSSFLETLSFRCGRPAKCACCVHMDPIIDCSSETLITIPY